MPLEEVGQIVRLGIERVRIRGRLAILSMLYSS